MLLYDMLTSGLKKPMLTNGVNIDFLKTDVNVF